MPHLSLSEEDIDKIATAVKQKITVDIESIITAKTEPLIFRILKLERENNELTANLTMEFVSLTMICLGLAWL
jgi:hypothetical protein